MALRDFFEDIIRPNLVELVGWLRVSEIQSQLMSARVITRTDDQKLRHEMKIELDKARYLLHDVLAYVDNRTFDKFRQIVKGSGKDVPTHRLAAELLYKESVHAKLTEPASIGEVELDTCTFSVACFVVCIAPGENYRGYHVTFRARASPTTAATEKARKNLENISC